MSDYHSQLEQMDNNQKEVLFQSILKSQLIMKNYIVAIPEPDIGDDIWVASLEKENYTIYPAQIKSAFAYHRLREGNVKRYLVNIKLHKLKSTLNRTYIYFLGLYDPDLESEKFHIGCIPSTFFLEHWDYLLGNKVISTRYNKRINLTVDYYVKEEEYFIFVKPLVKITSYFQSFDAIA